MAQHGQGFSEIGRVVAFRKVVVRRSKASLRIYGDFVTKSDATQTGQYSELPRTRLLFAGDPQRLPKTVRGLGRNTRRDR